MVAEVAEPAADQAVGTEPSRRPSRLRLEPACLRILRQIVLRSAHGSDLTLINEDDAPAGEVAAAELVWNTRRADRLAEDGHCAGTDRGGRLLLLLWGCRAAMRVTCDALERRAGRCIARTTASTQELGGSRHRLGAVDGSGTIGACCRDRATHAKSLIDWPEGVARNSVRTGAGDLCAAGAFVIGRRRAKVSVRVERRSGQRSSGPGVEGLLLLLLREGEARRPVARVRPTAGELLLLLCQCCRGLRILLPGRGGAAIGRRLAATPDGGGGADLMRRRELFLPAAPSLALLLLGTGVGRVGPAAKDPTRLMYSRKRARHSGHARASESV